MGFLNCHMSPHKCPSQMDTCENQNHILLDGQDIISLLIMMNVEIMFKCHMSPYNWASQMNTCHHGQPL
jgi:hypothetical protein